MREQGKGEGKKRGKMEEENWCLAYFVFIINKVAFGLLQYNIIVHEELLKFCVLSLQNN